MAEKGKRKWAGKLRRLRPGRTKRASRRAGPVVLDLQQITEIENRYVERDEPCLEAARDALIDRWNADASDRETLLRLFFLEWLSCSDMDSRTGLVDYFRPSDGYSRSTSAGVERTATTS